MVIQVDTGVLLTALTTAIAFVDLGGGWNNVAALTIAIVKALLVILYFMHLRASDRFTWVLAGRGIFLALDPPRRNVGRFADA
jgi:cytochrome c oxidase subunit 4